MKRKLWVFTGGHHNSALVVAQELVKKGESVTWFGHRHAAKGDGNDSAEYQEVTKAGIPFFDLPAGKLGSKPWKIPYGILVAFSRLKALSPQAVVSFGGYLGFATGIAAFFLGIPVFLHEQTVVAGKANKIISLFARRIYLTWESSLSHLPKKSNAVVVGLPLRPGLLARPHVKLFANGKPTILVVGGKQGSHAINKVILGHLKTLLSRYNIIHQTGTSSVTGDYEAALAAQNALPPDLVSHYRPVGYLGEQELSIMLASCDLVIGRSGAHTTYELGILGKKCILIPFMHTHAHEQLHNARYLERAGLAIVLGESSLTFPRLVQSISDILRRRQVTAPKLPQDASIVMIEDMLHAL